MELPTRGSLLVAGAGGFIGRSVASRAAALGLDVTALSLGGASSPGMTTIAADVTRPDALRSALAGHRFDYVINLAGYIDHSGLFSGGRAVFEQHFSGLINLLECTRHEDLRGFVQVGSSDEYGDLSAPQSEDLREAPISPYSLAKMAATHLVEMLWRTERFPARAARLFLVYGPGQATDRFIPQLIRGALSGERFPVSAGEQLRDFCYVEDIADGLLALLHCDAANGQCLNLASGQPVSIRTVIDKVVQSVGGGNPEFGVIPYRAGENMALHADTGRARQLLGWSPTVALDDGLARTIRWYREQPAA